MESNYWNNHLLNILFLFWLNNQGKKHFGSYIQVTRPDSCFSWKWHFFDRKHHSRWKNTHNSVKTYDILIKWKLSESWWSAFVISAEKDFSIVGVGHNHPFSVQIACKKTNFKKGFASFFSAGLQQFFKINCIP